MCDLLVGFGGQGVVGAVDGVEPAEQVNYVGGIPCGASRAFEPIAQDYVDDEPRRVRRARLVRAVGSAAALLFAVCVGTVLAVDTSRPDMLPSRGQAVATAKRWIDQVLADPHYAGGYQIQSEDLACPSDPGAHGELETVATLTSLVADRAR